MPALQIFAGQNSIDGLMFIYKQYLKKSKSYLTYNGMINRINLNSFLQQIKKLECEICYDLKHPSLDEQQICDQFVNEYISETVWPADNHSMNKYLQSFLSYFENKKISQTNQQITQQEKEQFHQTLKKNYNKEKFNFSSTDFDEIIEFLSLSYITGILWNFTYFIKGCQSWVQFYPFNYAPFCSDLILSSTKPLLQIIHFKSNRLEQDDLFLKPIQQLFYIIQKKDQYLLPSCYQELMLSDDSIILDLYPDSVKQDSHQYRFPIIDEQRLQQFSRELENLLNDDEQKRNSIHENKIVFNKNLKQSLLDDISKIQVNNEQFNLCYKDHQINGQLHQFASKIYDDYKDIQAYNLKINTINFNYILLQQTKPTNYEISSELQNQFEQDFNSQLEIKILSKIQSLQTVDVDQKKKTLNNLHPAISNKYRLNPSQTKTISSVISFAPESLHMLNQQKTNQKFKNQYDNLLLKSIQPKLKQQVQKSQIQAVNKNQLLNQLNTPNLEQLTNIQDNQYKTKQKFFQSNQIISNPLIFNQQQLNQTKIQPNYQQNIQFQQQQQLNKFQFKQQQASNEFQLYNRNLSAPQLQKRSNPVNLFELEKDIRFQSPYQKYQPLNLLKRNPNQL